VRAQNNTRATFGRTEPGKQTLAPRSRLSAYGFDAHGGSVGDDLDLVRVVPHADDRLGVERTRLIDQSGLGSLASGDGCLERLGAAGGRSAQGNAAHDAEDGGDTLAGDLAAGRDHDRGRHTDRLEGSVGHPPIVAGVPGDVDNERRLTEPSLSIANAHDSRALRDGRSAKRHPSFSHDAQVREHTSPGKGHSDVIEPPGQVSGRPRGHHPSNLPAARVSGEAMRHRERHVKGADEEDISMNKDTTTTAKVEGPASLSTEEAALTADASCLCSAASRRIEKIAVSSRPASLGTRFGSGTTALMFSVVTWPDVLRVIARDEVRDAVLGRYRAAGFTPDDFATKRRAREAMADALSRAEDISPAAAIQDVRRRLEWELWP
jgi:hypothetical protein